MITAGDRAPEGLEDWFRTIGRPRRPGETMPSATSAPLRRGGHASASLQWAQGYRSPRPQHDHQDHHAPRIVTSTYRQQLSPAGGERPKNQG